MRICHLTVIFLSYDPTFESYCFLKNINKNSIPNNLVAGLDLGSNSFKLMIARIKFHKDKLHVQEIDTIKSTLRLSAGISADGNINDETFDKALSTLMRFGDRIQDFPKNSVTVVATNAFRVAKNGDNLIREGEKLLGFPIKLLSGKDEAELVFQGASHVAPFCEGSRLVIDIGGSSTEIILGKDEKISVFDSLQMGCVTFSRDFFLDGKLTEKNFSLAESRAEKILKNIFKKYKKFSYQQVVGSSGTIRAIADIIAANNLDHLSKLPIDNIGTLITLKGLEQIKQYLIDAGDTKKLNLNGLKTERKPVIAGGLSVLLAIFKVFKIEMMEVSESAIIFGAIHESILKNINIQSQDKYAGVSKKIIPIDDFDSEYDRRIDEVAEWAKQFSVDLPQAKRVSALATEIFKNLSSEDNESYQNSHKILQWASMLHEIGLAINYRKYNVHSAYIISNKELTAFTISDQARLASLVLGHRGNLEKIKFPSDYMDWALLFALRVAYIFYKKRNNQLLPKCTYMEKKSKKYLVIDEAWLKNYPFLRFGLTKELNIWKKIDCQYQLLLD